VQLALVVLLMLAFPLLLRGASALVCREWDKIQAQRAPAGPPAPPIERVARDLRRLRYQLELRENGPGNVGKGMKMGAVRAAYVEVLSTACRQLDVRPPQALGRSQPPLAEIYRVEAELRQRGLDVRWPEVGGAAA